MYGDKHFDHILTQFVSILSLVVVLSLSACSSTEKKPTERVMSKPEPSRSVTQSEPVFIPPEAEPITQAVVNSDVNERYVVKKGDTLWDIAARFLKSPWLWPEMWHINTQIRNPHLIFPGDVILLYYVDGKPYLTLEGAAGSRPTLPEGVGTVKMTPKLRYKNLDQAIDTLPRNAVAAFLSNPRVLTKEEFEDAPYIFSSQEQHLVNGQGDRVYVRNVQDKRQAQYVIVRRGDRYIDPENNEILGYEAQDIADARMIRVGKPSTIIITRARKEVLHNDVLIPHNEEKLNFNFFPRAPRKTIGGKIIAVYDGLSRIGQYNIVVLNRGTEHGIEIGHVLAVFQAGDYARDSRYGEEVLLPEERAGLLMVFRTFEKLSYGLIMEAERALKVLDSVRNP